MGGKFVGSCFGKSMDCRLFPQSVHQKGKCVDTELVVGATQTAKSYSAHAAQCKAAYIGNGFKCVNKPNSCKYVCCDSKTSQLGIREDFCDCSNYNCKEITTT